MKILIAVLSATAAVAQPNIDLSTKPCPVTDKPSLASFVATKRPDGTAALVPVCLQIGAGLKINMEAAGGPSMESSVLPVTSAAPRMVYERVSLDGVPVEQTTLTYTLSSTPAPNTLIIAAHRIPTWWTQQVDVAVPDGRMLTITLPTARTAQAGDSVLLVYWTADPAAPAVRRVLP